MISKTSTVRIAWCDIVCWVVVGLRVTGSLHWIWTFIPFSMPLPILKWMQLFFGVVFMRFSLLLYQSRLWTWLLSWIFLPKSLPDITLTFSAVTDQTPVRQGNGAAWPSDSSMRLAFDLGLLFMNWKIQWAFWTYQVLVSSLLALSEPCGGHQQSTGRVVPVVTGQNG